MALQANLPDWSEELFKPYRYKTMHGGRGSAKSWTVARSLLIQAAMKPLRIGCFREVQDSIRDSVHRLLGDQIQGLGLGGHYDVTQNEIRHRNGSMFLFSGLSQHTVESIKSFEGLDIAWVEEAQSVSKRSWDVLTPTIRKPDSEIWSTLNPHLETDETYQRLIARPPTNSWVRRINWRDNPWFPAVLDQERIDFLARDPDNYGNIWEGEPLRVAEGAIYRHEVDAMYAAGRVRPVPHDPILKVHTVWDLGWNDAMAIGLFQRSASELRCIGYIEDSHHTVDWYVRKLEKHEDYRWGFDFIPHDGRTRDHNSGKSTEDILRAMGRRPVVLGNLSVEEGIKAARMVFPRLYVDDKCQRFLECLKRYRRIVSKLGEAMGPLHDEFSHGADMWRYTALAVENMVNGEMETRSYEPEAYAD